MVGLGKAKEYSLQPTLKKSVNFFNACVNRMLKTEVCLHLAKSFRIFASSKQRITPTCRATNNNTNNEMKSNNTTFQTIWKDLRANIKKALGCEDENLTPSLREIGESQLAEFDKQIEEMEEAAKLLPKNLDLSNWEKLKNYPNKEDNLDGDTNNEDDVILVPTNDEEFLTELNKEMARQRRNGERDPWRLVALGMIYHLYKLEEFRKIGKIDLSNWEYLKNYEGCVI